MAVAAAAAWPPDSRSAPAAATAHARYAVTVGGRGGRRRHCRRVAGRTGSACGSVRGPPPGGKRGRAGPAPDGRSGVPTGGVRLGWVAAGADGLRERPAGPAPFRAACGRPGPPGRRRRRLPKDGRRAASRPGSPARGRAGAAAGTGVTGVSEGGIAGVSAAAGAAAAASDSRLTLGTRGRSRRARESGSVRAWTAGRAARPACDGAAALGLLRHQRPRWRRAAPADRAELILHVDAVLAAQVEQVLALHVQFVGQMINANLLVLQAELPCVVYSDRRRPLHRSVLTVTLVHSTRPPTPRFNAGPLRYGERSGVSHLIRRPFRGVIPNQAG